MNTKLIAQRVATLVLALTSIAFAAENKFAGDWALTIPGGHAGWLRISDDSGKPTGEILWGFGSVVPVDEVKLDGDTLVLTRLHRSQRKDADGKTIREVTTETITATLDGQKLNLVTSKMLPNGEQGGKETFSGKRMPPAPAKPDLSKVKFGQPVQLFNGKDLAGWKLLEPNAANGWSVKDGVLSNNPVQEQGKPHKNYGNLRTEKEFEDFNLSMEVSVPKGGNSGVYLRGIYEIQVADTYGRGTDSHNMGGVYSRIKPTESAEKPASEWQTLDITLVDRHATVILNGKKIIDNQFVPGPTGGALWSDPTRPGPLYLQGDHSGVNYRNMVLKPVVK
jgi:hypothetical protein